MAPTLDEALANGALAAWSKGQVSLRLQFADSEDGFVFARTLQEMPLAENQEIQRDDTGKLVLTAEVANTSALRRMLQSMAREAGVLEPTSLREEIQRFLADSMAFQQVD